MISSLVLVTFLSVCPCETPILDAIVTPVRVMQRVAEAKPLRSLVVRVTERKPLRRAVGRVARPLQRKPICRALGVYRVTLYK